MNKINLLKSFSANKGNLFLALQSIVKDLYCTVVEDESHDLDEINTIVGILTSIINDLYQIDQHFLYINNIKDKGV